MWATTSYQLTPVFRDVVVAKFVRNRKPLAGASRDVTIVAVTEDDPITVAINKHAVELAFAV